MGNEIPRIAEVRVELPSSIDKAILMISYSIGGNLGSVNSFAGVDVSGVTNGVLNAADLLKNNNLLCFVFEVLKTVSPDALTNIYSTVSAPLELVMSLIATSLLNLTCPAFEDMTYSGQPLWKGLQEAFPGAGWAQAAL